MAPPFSGWKSLIDNGKSLMEGGLVNVTDLTAKMPAIDAEDSLRHPEQPQPASAGNLGSDLLPVYCGILGCLIVGLVVWILFKQLRRQRPQEDKLLPAEHHQRQLRASVGDEEAHEHHHQHHHQHHHRHHRDEAQPEHPNQNQQLMYHFPVMGQKRKSSDSGFYGSEAAAAITAEASVRADIRRRLLRDLSESRLQRLENILANDPDPNGWRRLAHELGLSSDDLAKLECQSARGNQSAIRLMLKTWAARDGSSVGQLIRCLQHVGRSDALILFRETSVPAALRRAHRKCRKQQKQQQQQQQQNPEQEVELENHQPNDLEVADEASGNTTVIVTAESAAAASDELVQREV